MLNLYKISMETGILAGILGSVLAVIIGFSPRLRKETGSQGGHKQTKKRVGAALISSILIVALLVLMFIIMLLFKLSGMIPEEVPSVEGMLYVDAVEYLQKADFLEKVICEGESENWSNYVVEKQVPSGGETALTKTKVKLYLTPSEMQQESSNTYREDSVFTPQMMSTVFVVVDPGLTDANIGPFSARCGEEVKLHVGALNYIYTIKFIDSSGNELPYEYEDGENFVFTMPDCDVTVYLNKAEPEFDPTIPPEPVVPETVCDYGLGCPTRSFSDLDPDEWYHEAVDFVISGELMSGYDDRFIPDGTLTRAEAAALFFILEGCPSATTNYSFIDVPYTAWYATAVSWAADVGLIEGYDDNTFQPSTLITMEQFITILWRYAGSPDNRFPYIAFTDQEEISQYASSAVDWAAGEGFLRFTNGTLNAHKNITRVEVAEILKNYIIGN